MVEMLFKRILVLCLGLFFGLEAAAMAQVASAAATADELRALIRKVETQHRGLTSHGKTRMIIVTKDWSRTLTMETWSEGRDRFLVQSEKRNHFGQLL